MTEFPNRQLEAAVPPPQYPFATLLPRVAAFAIDLVLIYFAGYTLEMAMREKLLLLGPALPFLSIVAAFVYFWLGNGPVGGGATLGKAILNLRVVDEHGRPLEWGPALRRTSLQLPPLLTASFVFLSDLLKLPGMTELLGMQFVSILSTTLMLSNAFGIFGHPRHRGWHDLWAGSYVTPDPTPAAFREMLGEPPDASLELRLKTHARTRVSFTVVVFGVLIAGGLSGVFNPRLKGEIALGEALEREGPIADYELLSFDSRSTEDWEAALRIQRDPKAAVTLAEESATSATAPLRREAPPANVFLIRYTRTRGPATPADMNDSARRGQIEALRQKLPEILRARGDAAGLSPAVLSRVVFLLRDRFMFCGFPIGNDRLWSAQGPFDAANGLLAYEWFPAEGGAAKNAGGGLR